MNIKRYTTQQMLDDWEKGMLPSLSDKPTPVFNIQVKVTIKKVKEVEYVGDSGVLR